MEPTTVWDISAQEGSLTREMRAIRIDEWGGPEVLRLVEDAPVPEPAEGETLIRVSLAGINYADTHARENEYLARYELPLIPGGEVAGTTEDGARVVALVANGGYAEYAVAPFPIPIPDDVSYAQALALLAQGLTAWHLYKTSAKLEPGESVVVHAGAGGVGSLAVQLGKAFGARVIATASTLQKRELALELGADAAVDVTDPDLAARLREANGGKRVDVVLEMAGGSVFDASLEALAPFGRLVVYGMASHEANQVGSGALMHGSKGVIGFWLVRALRRPEMVGPPLQDLFSRVASGSLRVIEGGTYPLSEAGRAHEEMQARSTVGKLVLDPRR
jgi:NADPH2:quinone reductase